jgi:hypothetical protein
VGLPRAQDRAHGHRRGRERHHRHRVAAVRNRQ